MLGSYEKDFYAGEPCVTVNALGAGRACYIATRPSPGFLDEFYAEAFKHADIAPLIEALPAGVDVARRGNTLFVMNFTGAPVTVTLPRGTDALTGEAVGGETTLAVNGIRVIRV